MALDLNALATRRAKITVDFMGQSADVKYDPSYLTQETMALLRSGDDVNFMTEFSKLVVDWDVKKGNKKVPLTVNGLKGVPILFMRAVTRAILAADDDVVDEGKDSNGG